MSRRNRLRRAARAAAGASPVPLTPAIEPSETVPARDGLRRLLMLLLTALLITRTLVGGEDAGNLSDLSDPINLFCNLLTLVGCVGWAGWRLWSKQSILPMGWVEVVLFVFVGLLFFASSWASYARPAWLIAWDWLGLALTVFLIRQLTIRSDERQGLLAVVLALGVAVAANGVYQVVWEQPRLASEVEEAGGPVEYIRLILLRQARTPTTQEAAQLGQVLERNLAHGPYLSPDSLAAVLVLVFPGLIGLAVASRRGGGPLWQTIFVGLLALLAGAALWLTGNRAGIAALTLAGVGLALVLVWPRAVGGWKVGVVVALTAVAGLGFGLVRTGLLAQTVSHCAAVWPIAWKIVSGVFWTGLGPGQFELIYPSRMRPDSPLTSDPASCLLHLWSEVGIGGVVLLFIGLLLLVRAVVRWAAQPTADPSGEEESGELVVGWEYHTGGMFGLLMAFVLKASGLPGEDVINEALAASVRSVAWFAAFALFETIVWSDEEYVAALATGLSGWLLLLGVQGGLQSPAVIGLGLTTVALLLAVVEPVPAWLGRQTVVRLAPLPIALGLTLVYLGVVFLPLANTSSVLRRAQQANLQMRTDMARPSVERTISNPARFVREQIIRPLVQTSVQDQGNVRLLVQIAEGYRQLYNPTEAAPRGGRTAGEWAVTYASMARQASPASPEGYWSIFETHWHVANVLQLLMSQAEQDKGTDKKPPALSPEEKRRLIQDWRLKRQQQADFAAQALISYLPYDPTDPQLRYRLAEALFVQGKLAEAREQVQEAARLNREVPPERRLSKPQAEQLERWLLQKSSG